MAGGQAPPAIQFCTAKDGTKIAYAITGEGYPIVRAAHYLSHLEFDFESPVHRHWIRELSRNNTYVRYDERGCGLSDWNPRDFSFESWVTDLETVVDQLGLEKFALLGISQGGPVGIAYAVRHPDRVSHLILYGTYSLGWNRRQTHATDPTGAALRESMRPLIELGWGQENPVFRQLFTSLFMPEAGPEEARWFNELQRVSCPPANAVRFDRVFAEIDVSMLAPKLRVPTLILHARRDEVVPFEEGRLLASQIPGARFVSFDGRNHILREDEPGWSTFVGEVRGFLGTVPRASPSGEVGLERPGEAPDAEVRETVLHLGEVSLARFAVVGNYVRFRADVRNALKDRKQRIVAGLAARTPHPQNHLLWGPPGSGKSFFVQEIARSLAGSAQYAELNLAELGETAFADALGALANRAAPTLCLVDEIDAKPAESWPFEQLLPSMERGGTNSPVVFVLAGSSTSGLVEMKERLGTRPKGRDLLSRIPAGNEFSLPPLETGDVALLVLAQLRGAGQALGTPVNEVERLALYYVCHQPRFASPRQLRELARETVARFPRGEDRVKYDHLFPPGDPENKEFWSRMDRQRDGLAGQFVSISD